MSRQSRSATIRAALVKKAMQRLWLSLLVVIALLVGGGWLLHLWLGTRAARNFDECMKHPKAVLESYPVICISQQGKSFTDPVGDSCRNEPELSYRCYQEMQHQ